MARTSMQHLYLAGDSTSKPALILIRPKGRRQPILLVSTEDSAPAIGQAAAGPTQY
jgi:hypothetical protein